MIRKILRVAAWIAAIELVALITGTMISRKLSKGDEGSNDF